MAKLIPIQCPLCGAPLSIPDQESKYVCPYCTGALLYESQLSPSRTASDAALYYRTEAVLKEAEEIENKSPNKAYSLVSSLVNNNQTDWRVFWYLCKHSDYCEANRLSVCGYKYCNLSCYNAAMKFCTELKVKQSLEQEYFDYWKNMLKCWIQDPGAFPVFIEKSNPYSEYIIGRPNERRIYDAHDSGDRSTWWYMDSIYKQWFKEIPEFIQDTLREYVDKGVQNAFKINSKLPEKPRAVSYSSAYSARQVQKIMDLQQMKEERYFDEVRAFLNRYIDTPIGASRPNNTYIACAIGRTIILSMRGSDPYDYAVPAKQLWN